MSSLPLSAAGLAAPESPVPGVVGPVHLRGTPGFATEVNGANLALTPSPDVVVGATCAADVVASMLHASGHGMHLSVQATGHGPAEPHHDGLLVSTRRMDFVGVEAGARTALVGAGARWGQVVQAAAPHGLAPLCASSMGVGVVGHVLGGGLGPMARTFGFSSDHVRALELVVPSGEVLQVDAATEPELFWGLRGGKCELGVVTALEIDLEPVPYVYGGGLYYSADQAPRLLRAWRDWSAWLPEEVNTSVALVRLPDDGEVPEPLRGRLAVHLRYVYVGRAEDGELLLEPMREVARPVEDRTGWLPFEAVGLVHDEPGRPMPAWGRGVLLDELSNSGIDALVGVFGPDRGTAARLVELRLLGGALTAPGRGPSAVTGRGAGYHCWVTGRPGPGGAQEVRSVATSVLRALDPAGVGNTLVNFQGDRTGPEAVRGVWRPEDRQRLDDLHATYDPEGVCRFGLPTGRATGSLLS